MTFILSFVEVVGGGSNRITYLSLVKLCNVIIIL